MQCNLLLIVWSGRISQETLLLAKELEKNSAFQLGPKTEKITVKSWESDQLYSYFLLIDQFGFVVYTFFFMTI
jgi:hypothetical protein